MQKYINISNISENLEVKMRWSAGKGYRCQYADGMEKEVATSSSILAWKISWIEEPGRL